MSARARISPASDGSRAQHSVGLALDALCAAAPDASPRRPSITKMDVGLAADMGTLAGVPKLVRNASLFHELALSVRTFGADDAAVTWSRVERRDWFEGGGDGRSCGSASLLLWGQLLSTISSGSSRMLRQQGKRSYNAERHGSNNSILLPAAFQQPRRFIAVDY